VRAAILDEVAHARRQTPGEELANSVSHGLGLLAGLVALPWLLVAALPRGTSALAGAAIFGATLALMYLASTLYHAIAHPPAKRVLKTLDHSAIYLLIAGTYTPFTLGAMRGPWGWGVLAAVWTLALLGVALKVTGTLRHGGWSTALYVAMGWLVLVAVKPLWEAVPVWGIVWLAGGGLAYTLGVAFYAADDRVRYAHFVWHLFVLAGSACHFVAVLRFA